MISRQKNILIWRLVIFMFRRGVVLFVYFSSNNFGIDKIPSLQKFKNRNGGLVEYNQAYKGNMLELDKWRYTMTKV